MGQLWYVLYGRHSTYIWPFTPDPSKTAFCTPTLLLNLDQTQCERIRVSKCMYYTIQERATPFGWHSTENTYSSVYGPRWCADSWDTMEQSELPPMQSLVKAQEPSGWMMWRVLAQSHPWTDAPSVDGTSTTVCMTKMQEWCAKVLIVHMSRLGMQMYRITHVPAIPPPPPYLIQWLLYVWWEAPPLKVVVWKCSTMEYREQCVTTHGTSRMPL